MGKSIIRRIRSNNTGNNGNIICDSSGLLKIRIIMAAISFAVFVMLQCSIFSIYASAADKTVTVVADTLSGAGTVKVSQGDWDTTYRVIITPNEDGIYHFTVPQGSNSYSAGVGVVEADLLESQTASAYSYYIVWEGDGEVFAKLDKGKKYYIDMSPSVGFTGGTTMKYDYVLNVTVGDNPFSITSFELSGTSKIEHDITTGDTVKGLAWNPASNTLTMNGYDGGPIRISNQAKNNIGSVNVVVTGSNKIDRKGILIGTDWYGTYNSGFLVCNADCVITGDGSLSITDSKANGSVSDVNAICTIGALTIDGPAIDISGFESGIVSKTAKGPSDYDDVFGGRPSDVVIRSSVIKMKLNPEERNASSSEYDIKYRYSSAVSAYGDVVVDDAKLLITYEYDDTKYDNIEVDCWLGWSLEPVVISADFAAKVSGNTVISVSANEQLKDMQMFEGAKNGVVDIDEKNVVISTSYTEGAPAVAVIDVSGLNVKLSEDSFVYDGREHKPGVSISGMKEGTDYTVTYVNNINAGIAALKITGKGSFTGNKEVNFTINKADIANAGIGLSQTTFEYDGTEKKPAVTVQGLTEGVDYTLSYSNNAEIGSASAVITGIGNYTGTKSVEYTIAGRSGPAAGTVLAYGDYRYKVTKPAVYNKEAGELAVIGANSKKIKKINILTEVKIEDYTYNVTAIEAKAFSKYTKVTAVTIGDGVRNIGSNAFSKCSKLTRVTMGKGVTDIGANAFVECKKLSAVKINSSYLQTIGKTAFSKDKKLKNVTIKSTKLTKIGKNAFKGIHKKAVFKLPKSKLKAYKKLIKKAGAGSKVTYKK